MDKCMAVVAWVFLFLTAGATLVSGQEPTARMRAVDSRLITAVEKGDLKEMTAALDEGADVTKPGEDGYFPLHVAVREDRHEAAVLLLSRGAAVNAKSPFGETPLHLVRNAKTAELLLLRGADVDARDTEFEMTPLFNADVDVAAVLMSRGADKEATSKEGHTPLAWSAYWDNLQKTRFLLSRGARVDAGTGKTKTALHIAANWGRIDTARLLIAYGADVNARDGLGWTPLHWAAFEGGPQMVQFLISRGATADARTLKAWAIFPAGSTIKDIEEISRGGARETPLNYLKGNQAERGR